MDILIFNWKDINHPEAGGAEIIAFELARRLIKDGHTVTFFARHFLNAKKEEVFHGIKIIRKGNRYTVYIHAFFYYINLKRKPDKVVEMVNTLCWQTPLYVPKEKRVGYVNQLAKEVLFFELSWPISVLSFWFERFQYVFYRTTKILCYSKSTKEDLLSFGIPDKNIQIFPLGLDQNRYAAGEKTSYPSFVFVARLVKMKRADLCIQAMEHVALRYPQARLYIVGTGPDEQRLYSIMRTLSLQSEISFINKDNFFIESNNKDKKVTLMQQAWALLLPSVKEGWGMVVTEAGACGTPAIVSRVTGLKDSVIEEKTGLFVSADPSARELANSMIRLIEDKKLRLNLSKDAMLFAHTFTWEKSYHEFAKLLLSKQNIT